MRAGLRAEVGLGRAVPGWQRWAEAEQVFEAELGVGLRELAVNRVRGELVEEREDLVEDAALVALDALEADDFAALSEREAARAASGSCAPAANASRTIACSTVKVVGAASGHAGIVKASCVEGAGGARF